MKIITWNINSVRLRINLLEDLAKLDDPDVICLQETKVTDDLFPKEAIENMGYKHMVFSGQKSYNGVAILSKTPIDTNFSLSFFNDDKRHISAKIKGFEIHNFYVPAGGDEPDIDLNPKYHHKIEYINLMHNWLQENRIQPNNMILCGDLNIAPHEHDVWSSKQLTKVISHTKIEREKLLALQESFDFIDTGRFFTNHSEKLYSWWSYRHRDWKKSNRGRRLDHIWISSDLKSQLVQTKYYRELRDWERPSDHIPIMTEIS